MIRGTLACHAMRVNANGTSVPIHYTLGDAGSGREPPSPLAGADLPWRVRISLPPGGRGPPLAGADLPPPGRRGSPSPLVGEGRGEGEVRPGRPVGHMGYHRRVRYLDVVTNKKRIDAERGKSLNALAEQTQALKMR